MRKTEEPKISFTMIRFSGDNAAFRSFVNGMIQDYLNLVFYSRIKPYFHQRLPENLVE